MFSRRFFCWLLLILNLLLAGPVMAGSASRAGPRLVVNGRQLELDVPPAIENGRVLAPLRAAAEALSAAVYYEPATRQVTVTGKKGVTVTLAPDTPWAQVGDRTVLLEAPPRLSGGRTLVPLRFLSETLGVYVAWEPVTGTVYLSEDLLHLPGQTRPLTKSTIILYRDGVRAGIKLTQPAAGYVEADTRVNLQGTIQNGATEVVAVVEKGTERSDQPLDVENGTFTGQVWLPFGPGEYTVTICNPPKGNELAGLAGFKVRNVGRQDLRTLAPVDWIDWHHPEILALARQLKRDDVLTTVTAIHDWIAENITYDVAASRQQWIPQKRASAVLRSRSGVCEHFSRLMAALCRANGIPAVVVRGYARRKNEPWPAEPNHAWNEVLINGRWVTIDATLDAGYVVNDRFIKEFSRKYFDPDPARLALTHRKQPSQ
ncbi:MAG: stalk domain-containing protein [Bacillota bacterium]|nr:stalk domain-containing protein [Thermoanaerobacteraceae bacterium]